MNDQNFQRPYSGYADLIGYRLCKRGQGEAEIELRLEPRHLNRLLVPHGGLIASLIDTAAGFAVAFAKGPDTIEPAVTLSLSLQFLGQAKAGDLLIASAKRDGGGRTIAFASAEVKTDDGRIVARGQATFRFLSSKS